MSELTVRLTHVMTGGGYIGRTPVSPPSDCSAKIALAIKVRPNLRIAHLPNVSLNRTCPRPEFHKAETDLNCPDKLHGSLGSVVVHSLPGNQPDEFSNPCAGHTSYVCRQGDPDNSMAVMGRPSAVSEMNNLKVPDPPIMLRLTRTITSRSANMIGQRVADLVRQQL